MTEGRGGVDNLNLILVEINLRAFCGEIVRLSCLLMSVVKHEILRSAIIMCTVHSDSSLTQY